LHKGRWGLCDIEGKHGRVRTVVCPPWAAVRVNRWLAHRYGATDSALSPLLTPVRGDIRSALSVSAVWKIVQGYATALSWGPVAPHDLRRTYARLCREGGCPMDELQMALGHESVRTTERYVNARLDVGRAAGDWIAL
jgi:integrase